ncbi:MAG: hypothetical protein IAI49_13860 [Candidatus Eremiobacteraeota bacterium]|nr:hypothetical protein [Candidatus Eremiobacteraeota bacterium]
MNETPRFGTSLLAAAGMFAVVALFACISWAAAGAASPRAGRADGALELALALVAMVAIFGITRILLADSSVEPPKELRR